MLTITAVRHVWPEPADFCLYRPNGHPDHTFVHFITEVELHLSDRSYVLPPHACILYRPGTIQHFISRTPLTHDWIHFSGELSAAAAALPADTPLYPQRTEFITEIVRELENEFFTCRPAREQLIQTKMDELFIKLLRELHSENRCHVDADTLTALRTLRTDILRTLSHPWSVNKMAAYTGLSPSRFHSVYRSVYGNSPVDDLIHARIDAARRLLLFSKQSVAEVGEALGYSNTTHFIRQFKAFTGLTPARYRREGEYTAPR